MGWRKIVKEHGNELNQSLSINDLYNFLKDIQKDIQKDRKRLLHFTPKHYTWTEDGVEYSSWEIAPGMFTGDAGMENYLKELHKYAKSLSVGGSKRTTKKSRKGL